MLTFYECSFTKLRATCMILAGVVICYSLQRIQHGLNNIPQVSRIISAQSSELCFTVTPDETNKSVLATYMKGNTLSTGLGNTVDNSGSVLTNPSSPAKTVRVLKESAATVHGERYVADWKVIQENVSYVYSAHLDPRLGPCVVRMFGSVHTDHLNDTLQCQLWIEGIESMIVLAKINLQHPRLSTFRGVDIDCYFVCDPWAISADTTVTVMTEHNVTGVSVHVEQTFKSKGNRNFTVCLWQPLFTADAKWMVEWMEANIMFGAEMFFIYNFKTAPNMKSVLDYYRTNGQLVLLSWSEPNLKIPRVHLERQLTMIGDCQQRNINQTRYLVGVDFDEIIVPRGNASTWQEMINRSSCKNGSAYVVRNHLYVSNYRIKFDRLCSKLQPCYRNCNATASGNTSHFLRTMCTTERTRKVNEFYTRSKYMASPTDLARLTVHTPGLAKSKIVCRMNTTVGALHHYRYDKLEATTMDDMSIYDDYMQIFWTRLSTRVNYVRNCLLASHVTI